MINVMPGAPVQIPAASEDFFVVGMAVTGIVVTICIGNVVIMGIGVGDGTVVGRDFRIVNVADPLTFWIIPLTVTI